jgi:hypothetical protein
MPLQLNPYFLYKRKRLLHLKAAIFERKINVKFLLASLKTLTISKLLYSGSRSKFFVRLFFSAIGRFSSLLLCHW